MAEFDVVDATNPSPTNAQVALLAAAGLYEGAGSGYNTQVLVSADRFKHWLDNNS